MAPSGSLALRFEGPAHLLDLLRRRFAAWPPAPGAVDAAALRIAVSDLEDGVEPAPARLPQIGLNGPRLTLNGPGLCASADLATGKASAAVAGPQAEALLDYLARVLTALLLDQAGGLLLHGAGLVRAGRGLLLLGPSGTGKTTAARNAAGAIVLNDDLVALLPAADGAWQLLATPFSNPTQVAPVPGQAPLAGVLRLRQAAAPELRPLSRGQALAELAAAVPVLVADGGRMPALMARLNGLVAVSPCAILGLRDRPDYWPVVDAWLTGR